MKEYDHVSAFNFDFGAIMRIISSRHGNVWNLVRHAFEPESHRAAQCIVRLIGGISDRQHRRLPRGQ